MKASERWLEEFFWPKVDRTGDCWIWKAGLSAKGYGIIVYKGRKERAHRLIKAINDDILISEIPEKLLACHKCDNKLCVNPDHIFWGTGRDNMQDALKKGRAKPWGGKRWKSKLSLETVKQIIIRAGRGTPNTEIAKEFGVTEGSVRQIITGKTWNKPEVNAFREQWLGGKND